MQYFLIAGEASGDLHASTLIRAIKQEDREASFTFMGGDLMARATGSQPIVHYREVAFMGILPVLLNLRKIQQASRRVQQALLDSSPDVVIPVDFASFNFRYIFPFVREHLSCPIVYYIAPKLWAWRAGRITKLRHYTDLLLCILPFEQTYFLERGVKAIYVGNPCVDAQLQFEEIHGPTPTDRLSQIVLIAGSRRQELAENLPVMLQATEPFRSKYSIIIAGAPGLSPEDYQPYLRNDSDIEVHFGETYELMRRSAAALVTSGTATLETALWETPMVVCYRMGGWRMTRWLFEHFFSVKFISLVNLILGRNLVPELIADNASPQNIRRHLKELLSSDGTERKKQEEGLKELAQLVGRTPSAPQAAQAILRLIANKRTAATERDRQG